MQRLLDVPLTLDYFCGVCVCDLFCVLSQASHDVHTLWLISSLCGEKRLLMAVCTYVLCLLFKYWCFPLLSQEYKHKVLCTVIDSSLFQDQLPANPNPCPYPNTLSTVQSLHRTCLTKWLLCPQTMYTQYVLLPSRDNTEPDRTAENSKASLPQAGQNRASHLPLLTCWCNKW